MVCDLRKFTRKFTSIVEMKIKLIEEFQEQVPPTLDGRQSSKKWLVSQEDLNAMYATLAQSKKSDICLWCEGAGDENGGPSRKRKQSSDDCPTSSKHAEKEREINDVTAELKELHGGKFSEPQFRLWAMMVINGIHASKGTPPNIPMITGVTPTRAQGLLLRIPWRVVWLRLWLSCRSQHSMCLKVLHHTLPKELALLCPQLKPSICG